MANPTGSVLVTGANGGLGSAIVEQIVSTPELSSYHGLYTVRSPSTATRLRSALQNPNPHTHDTISLDLSLLGNVRKVAADINARVKAGEIPPIRALILNAGWQEFTAQTWTEDKFDTSFAANYLGHWLLVMLLLQSMDREAGRIVVIGSLAHDPSASQNLHGQFNDEKWKIIFAKGTGPIAKGTWSTTEEDPSWCSGLRRYAASKLCLLMMIPELQSRLDADPTLENISVLGVDPGIMPTDLARRGSWVVRVVIFQILLPLFVRVSVWLSPNGPLRTAKKSAGDVVAAAFDNGPGLGDHPKAIYMNGSNTGTMSEEANDWSKQEALWRDTVLYTKLKKDETALTNWG